MDKLSLFTTDTSGKVLYVRHGKTEFNYTKDIIGEDVQSHAELVDSCLHAQGLDSLKNAIRTLSTLKFEAIYCSPMKRTLQTVYHLLENHPQRESIIVYIHPLITEKVNGVHDYSFDIIKKKCEYNMKSKVKFNWTIFDTYFKTQIEQEMFQFAYCPKDIPELNALIKQVEELYSKGEKEAMKTTYAKFGEYLVGHKMNTFETHYHAFRRNICFKRFLLKKLTEDGTLEKTDEKILIVTHSALAKVGTSSKAYSLLDNMTSYPDDSHLCKNGEIISMHINPEICLNNKELEI